jgi:hypothetical protein
MTGNVAGFTLPPGLLRPDFARDGKVTVVLELRIPVPPDPLARIPLADVLGAAEVADCFALSDGEPYGGGEGGPPAAPGWTTVHDWQEEHGRNGGES